MLCCVDGCNRDAHYKKAVLCQKHYFRQWRYGTTDLMKSRKERQENPKGYQWIYRPDHPLRHKTSGYVAEHRAVLYAEYGEGPLACELCAKALTWKTCHVDHIDEDVRNNERSNLRPTCSGCNTWRSMPAPAEWNRTHVIEFEGKRLTPAEWARDPRVQVCGHQIVARKKAGMTDEQALFSPKVTHNGRPAVDRRPRKTSQKHERANAVAITVGDVTRTAAEWARQPGVTVGASGLVWRIRHGWAPEKAVFQKGRFV